MNGRFAWVALLCLGTLGCERLALIKKCRAIAQRVNTELDSMAWSAEAKPDATNLHAIAQRYAALAKELQTTNTGSEEIDRAVQDYANTLRTSGSRVDEYATDLGAGRPAAGAEPRAQAFEQETRRQRNAAKRFVQECQGH